MNRESKHPKYELRLPDLGVGFAITALSLCLLLPSLQRCRAGQRNVKCSDNLRRIGLAIANYHSMYNQLPRHGSGTFNFYSGEANPGHVGPNGIGGKGGGDNGMTLSYLVGILPQLGEQDLWESISEPSNETVQGKLSPGAYWSPMGPACEQRYYKPWTIDMEVLTCPSDPRNNEVTGRTNYAACLGDAVDYQMESSFRFMKNQGQWGDDPRAKARIDATGRGAFVFRQDMTFDQITDGLSFTILVGEIATHFDDLDARTTCSLGFGKTSEDSPSDFGIVNGHRFGWGMLDPARPQFLLPNTKIATEKDRHRGLRWADARTVFTGFTTISPPNSMLLVEGDTFNGSAIAPASSRHLGGAHVLFADRSTRYISDAIEAGDAYEGTIRLGQKGCLAPGSPSRHGFWGSMGTRASND